VPQNVRNISGVGKDVSHYLQFMANKFYGVYVLDKLTHWKWS